VTRIIPFADLATANLIVDAVYEGGTAGNTGDELLSKLLHVGNQGGFRRVGRRAMWYLTHRRRAGIGPMGWIPNICLRVFLNLIVSSSGHRHSVMVVSRTKE
jgi:hypothetical protein